MTSFQEEIKRDYHQTLKKPKSEPERDWRAGGDAEYKLGRQGDERAYFFDSIPVEAADNVLKVRSRRPESQDWISHVALHEVVRLMGTDSEWATSLKWRFETLRIVSYESYLRPGKIADTYSLNIAHDFILAGGGSTIKELIVSGLRLDDGPNGVKMADDFRKLCPNVTTLSVDENVAMWAARFGAQVEVVDVSIRADVKIAAISQHCTKLRSLEIHCTPPFGPIRIESPLCYKSAETLETLEIYGNYEYVSIEQIRNIQTRHRKLKRIAIKGDIDAVSQLLISYGHQLEWAELTSDNSWPLFRYFEEEDMRKIVSACGNARFKLRATREELVAGLNTLAGQLESVTYYGREGEAVDLNAFAAAWKKCTNLHKLELTDIVLR